MSLDLSSDKLIDMLCDYENQDNIEKVAMIYDILARRNDVESDFWRECFYESEDKFIPIIVEAKARYNQLSIHDVQLIQNMNLFKQALNRSDIEMDDYEAVLECLEEDLPDTSEKINLIKQKVDNKMSN